MIDTDFASHLARIALAHVGREYPHKLDQVLGGDGDLAPPRVLHPAFHGSFDWHSCVHGWWTLMTCLRLAPDMLEAGAVGARADQTFTADTIAGEVAYLDRPSTAGFERPYGWAWALGLHHEAQRHAERPWAAALYPLAHAFADRLRAFLPRLTYPIRSGAHGNTAFALTLALGWADANAPDLGDLIRLRAVEWYGGDRDAQAWEPDGDAFLSPTLCEAALMARVLEADDFEPWFAAFLPRAGEGEPHTLFTPAIVSDRGDGKIVHLDGLNLSRAWCWRSVAGLLPVEARVRARAAADAHEEASAHHLADDYAGEHWLATYALMARLGEGF